MATPPNFDHIFVFDFSPLEPKCIDTRGMEFTGSIEDLVKTKETVSKVHVELKDINPKAHVELKDTAQVVDFTTELRSLSLYHSDINYANLVENWLSGSKKCDTVTPEDWLSRSKKCDTVPPEDWLSGSKKCDTVTPEDKLQKHMNSTKVPAQYRVSYGLVKATWKDTVIDDELVASSGITLFGWANRLFPDASIKSTLDVYDWGKLGFSLTVALNDSEITRYLKPRLRLFHNDLGVDFTFNGHIVGSKLDYDHGQEIFTVFSQVGIIARFRKDSGYAKALIHWLQHLVNYFPEDTM